jgi:hypothetical protein
MSEDDSTGSHSSSATTVKLFLAFVTGVVVGAAACGLFLHSRADGGAEKIHAEPPPLVFEHRRGETVASNPAPSASNTVDTPADTSIAVEGIAADATLGLLPITSEDQSDENSTKHFVLRIPIKARPKTHINVKDLVLHILFYDNINGRTVVQTSANVNTRWLPPPADWVDRDTEELAVEYQLPKPEAQAAKREDRKYYGYLVRIYYQQRLQAATAEPDRLRQQYPAPPILPK